VSGECRFRTNLYQPTWHGNRQSGHGFLINSAHTNYFTSRTFKATHPVTFLKFNYLHLKLEI